MQSTTITTQTNPVSTHLVWQYREEIPAEEPLELQPVIERLRGIYLKHIDKKDELSIKIHAVAGKYILIDCSKITKASDVIKMAQECRNQFARVLYSDFDLTLLNTDGDYSRDLMQNPVELRGWKFDQWQIQEFIKLDKTCGFRDQAVSPFDKQPIPEELPIHPFAKDIVDLIKTIPALSQQTSAQQPLVPSQDQDNEIIAFQRWSYYKKMASKTVQLKHREAYQEQLKIDLADKTQVNETYVHEIIEHEAQKTRDYIAAREKEMEAEREEGEKTRKEIEKLQTQLKQKASEIDRLKIAMAAEEKKSSELQNELNIQRANYARLAQEIAQIRSECKKKRPWWKFW